MDKSILKNVIEKYSINNRFQFLMESSNSISYTRAISGFIGGIIAPKLRNHKKRYTLNDIIDDMKLDLGVDVNYMLL
ncbi:hypothetical protein H5410_015962 [Solanum commersonii]|uniref:Uncharacterized protein n=1 Tax=Solanum commersonii TaxID=4109 RepID=A0A9J5ZVZ8_SOLCO|nr:hypothetical protein H5410_015962 [Solanum commersonii]